MKYYKLNDLCTNIIDCPHSTPQWKSDGIRVVRNFNLQQQLKLLYDYWFTQFEFPDENGNSYKSSGGKMSFNHDLSMNIPYSWSTKKLSEICNIILGGTPNTDIPEYWNGTINWINSGEVAQFPVVKSELKITQAGVDNSPAKLMPIGTTIVSITGNIRTSILAINTCANQSVVGILESKYIKSQYIHQFMIRMIEQFKVMSTGNCQQHINKGTIEEAIIVIPDSRVLNAYYKVAKPLYDRITKNALENLELTHLRDWLLPMLMNGQATIQD